MKDFKPVTAGNMLQCLQTHSKYGWAKALIEERLQDCIQHEVTLREPLSSILKKSLNSSLV